MYVFNNNFGNISYYNDKLDININKKYCNDDIHQFINELEVIYLKINEKFNFICNFSDMEFINIPISFNKQLITFFTRNYKISENYLNQIVIITSSNFLKKLLNTIFLLYSMPHPVSIIKKKSN